VHKAVIAAGGDNAINGRPRTAAPISLSASFHPARNAGLLIEPAPRHWNQMDPTNSI